MTSYDEERLDNAYDLERLQAEAFLRDLLERRRRIHGVFQGPMSDSEVLVWLAGLIRPGAELNAAESYVAGFYAIWGFDALLQVLRVSLRERAS